MRHGNSLRQLGRDASHRSSLLRNLATSLVINEQIITTTAKAKELRRFADKVVTLGKKKNLAGVQAVLYTNDAVKKMMQVIVPRFESRNGGYTRVFRVGARFGVVWRAHIVQTR